MVDKIGRDTFFTVSHWMISELELDGNELLVYALIFNLSFFGEKKGFYGSQETLRSWVGAKSRTTVVTALNALVNKGLIVKDTIIDPKNNNNKFCQYYAKKYNDDSIYLENVKRETERILNKYSDENTLNLKKLKVELFYNNYLDVDTLEIIDRDNLIKHYPDLYNELKEELYDKLESNNLYKNCTTPCTNSVQPLYKFCT